jgi:hypothetical protein
MYTWGLHQFYLRYDLPQIRPFVRKFVDHRVCLSGIYPGVPVYTEVGILNGIAEMIQEWWLPLMRLTI